MCGKPADLDLQPERLKRWAADYRSKVESFDQWRKEKGPAEEPAEEPAAEEPSPPRKKSWGDWLMGGGGASDGGASGGGASGGGAAL